LQAGGRGSCTNGRLDPRNLAERLDQRLPEDRVLIEDRGSFCEWTPKHLRVPGVRRTAMIVSAFQHIGLGCRASWAPIKPIVTPKASSPVAETINVGVHVVSIWAASVCLSSNGRCVPTNTVLSMASPLRSITMKVGTEAT
jgi:hypothetical protein